MSRSARIREVRTRQGLGARAMRSLDRSARSPRLLDVPAREAGAEPQDDSFMRSLRVILFGVGSIGSHVADLLARAGVESLLLVDRSRIKPESVLTHPVLPRDIGRDKATLAGERAKAVCPATRVEVFDGPAEELPLSAYVGASAAILSSDNLSCELVVNQPCLNLGVPLIQASVHGATLVAQVRSLANLPGAGGPCLACSYQAADWEALDRGTVYSCTGGPARWNGIPTVSPAQLCSLAAGLAVTELQARSAGLVSPSESRLIEYCGYNHRTSVAALKRRSDCPCDHGSWQVIGWQRRLAAATPRQLFAAAGCDASEGLAEGSLTVAGYRFGRLGLCACPQHPVLERFRLLAGDGSACLACGAPLEWHPFYTHEVVPGAVLRPHLDRSLEELGAVAPQGVIVRRAGSAWLVHDRGRAAGRSVARQPRQQRKQVRA